MSQLVADDEGARCRLDDVVGDGFELVEFQDAVNLAKEPFQEAKVSPRDAFDRRDGLGIGEIIQVQRLAHTLPAPVQDEKEFFAAQGTVLVSESERAVELGIVPETLIDAGHADEDDGDIGAVMDITQELQRGGCEPLGFVNDQEFNVVRKSKGLIDFPVASEVPVDADPDLG